MRLVIIESPFAGNNRSINLAYLNRAIADSLGRGEAPFASHRMYTSTLDDSDPAQRNLGIKAGFAWWSSADLIVFYIDLGWSPGMKQALLFAINAGMIYEERRMEIIDPHPVRHPGRAP